ncbi:MAG: mitochondrial fission ELM1 family protein [Gammaproteobacteria bacterium]|nr:mitochondrial fission ELM1 family protein [Gammaproteobacteria bacterium]
MTQPSTSSLAPRPLTIWRFIDGKPGHENQSAGLVQALRVLRPVEVHDLPVPGEIAAVGAWLARRFPWGRALPAPDLLLGAGHATHWPLLAARRARGGRAVVLMRPTLPGGCFDLCVVPAHDRPRAAGNVLVTRGVLNRVRPGVAKDPRQGLILLGGPSKHHAWSTPRLVEQVRTIVAHDAARRWVLTTSRRTPAEVLTALRPQVDPECIELVPGETTAPDWLPAQLAWAGTVWVSADSVSMIYEALTSGAAVGLLEVPARGRDRVVRGVEALVAEGLLTTYARWLDGTELRAPRQPFNEAARAARAILARFFAADAYAS